MEFRPHNTAITRSKPSKPARVIAKMMLNSKTEILDYGCGKGTDVAFYGQHAKKAAGYDPHAGFGFDDRTTGFDLVTITYVLNVIPDEADRIQVLKSAVDRLGVNGVLVVSTRSPGEIETEAQKKGWARFGDGYITSKSRKTFQRGIGRAELEELGRKAGLTLVGELLNMSDTCTVIFRKG